MCKTAGTRGDCEIPLRRFSTTTTESNHCRRYIRRRSCPVKETTMCRAPNRSLMSLMLMCSVTMNGGKKATIQSRTMYEGPPPRLIGIGMDSDRVQGEGLLNALAERLQIMQLG